MHFIHQVNRIADLAEFIFRVHQDQAVLPGDVQLALDAGVAFVRALAQQHAPEGAQA